MKKIIYIPLDERPCNYEFPYKMFDQGEISVIRPPKAMMGNIALPADISGLRSWLLSEAGNAQGLVISIDAVVYGGLVPSRLHHETVVDLSKRLDVLKEVRAINPEMTIYAFHLIMRCPTYDSKEMEPPYCAEYGKSIFRYGYLRDLKSLGKISPEQETELAGLSIPEEFLDDFRSRREVNREINIRCLELVKAGVIDFLTIPQDDSSQYGWTAVDQNRIRNIIKSQSLVNKVYMFPGADEAGCVLMSRMAGKLFQKQPKVFIRYPSPASPTVFPSVEDRYLETMVKYQVAAAGGITVESLSECDAVLFVNAPADRILSAFGNEKPGRGMTVLRNVPEAAEFLAYAKNTLGKEIIVGDVTYGNGSKIEIYDLLVGNGLLLQIAGFGGWNTISNAIGSAIAQGFAYLQFGRTQKHLDFLVSRYVEDIGYCGYVRQLVMKNVLANHPKYNYYHVGEPNGEIAQIVKKELDKFISEAMKELRGVVKITKLELPWRRMYEIDCDAVFTGKTSEKANLS